MSYIECDHLRYRITWSLVTLNLLWNKMRQKWILNFFEFEVNFRRLETQRATAAASVLTTISSPNHWLALLGWTKSFAFTENLNYQPWTSCIRQIPVKTAEHLNSGFLPQTLWSEDFCQEPRQSPAVALVGGNSPSLPSRSWEPPFLALVLADDLTWSAQTLLICFQDRDKSLSWGGHTGFGKARLNLYSGAQAWAQSGLKNTGLALNSCLSWPKYRSE